jgi:hypothetical protein
MKDQLTELPSEPTGGSTGLRLIEAHHRLALWAGALCIVTLLAAFGVARSADAATAPSGVPFDGLHAALTVDEEGDEVFETEEGDPDPAECAAEAAEEVAEGEPVETECEEESGTDLSEAREAPEECLVRTTAATVSTSPAGATVHLSLRYTSWTPSTVAVSFTLRGNKGGLALGHATEHFAKKGVLKLTANLTDAETQRAVAAKEYDVTVHPVNTPAYCGKIFAQRLDAHKAVGKGRVWTD